MAQCPHVGFAAEKDRQRQRQRDAGQLIDRRGVHWRPRAPTERLTSRISQVECRGQGANSLDLRTPSFTALESAYGMNGKARNGRELLLREAGGLAERLELPAK